MSDTADASLGTDPEVSRAVRTIPHSSELDAPDEPGTVRAPVRRHVNPPLIALALAVGFLLGLLLAVLINPDASPGSADDPRQPTQSLVLSEDPTHPVP